MNKLRSLSRGFSRLLTSYLIITLIFVLLLVFFVYSSALYWQNNLQPRLYLAARTQAQILSQSQAERLAATIENSRPEALRDNVFNNLQELLLAEDPAIGGRFVLGVQLQIDYNLVQVPDGSLDFREGEFDCGSCFDFTVPMISNDAMILGLAELKISDRYLQQMSAEIKSALYAKSFLIVALIVVVWVVVMLLFHRINRAKQAIETSDRAKTRFMANVTHELKTPLNAIIGYAQLYRDNAELDRDVRAGMETIDRSANHLLTMINDILDFSRGSEHGLSIHPQEFALGAFLDNIVEMNRLKARLKSIKFEYQPPDRLPQTVVADEKRLRQVLLNLLSNAIKFTDAGSVRFEIRCVEVPAHKESGKQVNLGFHVYDSGIGISRSDLKQIFMPFVQLENAVTKAEGSGLGLSISQRLLELMGSELHVDSKPNQGSHFWFVLQVDTLGAALDSTSPEPQEHAVVTPQPESLQMLIEQALRHDVLKLRRSLQDLEQQPELAVFCQQVASYLRHYQFQALAGWLQQLSDQSD